MTQINIAEAKARLSELVARAEQGEEIILARAGKPVVRFEMLKAPRATPAQRLFSILPDRGPIPDGDIANRMDAPDRDLLASVEGVDEDSAWR